MTARRVSNIRPVRARGAACVRPFVEADIPQVAEVHRAVFQPAHETLAAYRDYFTQVFLQTATRRISSLVFEESDGRIAGFLGVVPRLVAIDGRQYPAAVSSQFIVHPSAHAGLVALRLARTYLEGPQDLSIADEANDASRRIWEGLGGSTALLLSMYWTRALRPARFGLSFLRARPRLAPLAAAAAPVAALADAFAARVPGSQLRLTPPSTTSEPLCASTALAHGVEACGHGTARVEYDEPGFQALLDRAALRSAAGSTLHALVKNGSAVAGWYVANMNGDGDVEVARISATPATIHAVLDHLFYHAWRAGAASVSGRVDPRFIEALSDKYCVFHRRGPWVLIGARHPELRRALDAGSTCLSRLDGEWSLGFHPSRV